MNKSLPQRNRHGPVFEAAFLNDEFHLVVGKVILIAEVGTVLFQEVGIEAGLATGLVEGFLLIIAFPGRVGDGVGMDGGEMGVVVEFGQRPGHLLTLTDHELAADGFVRVRHRFDRGVRRGVVEDGSARIAPRVGRYAHGDGSLDGRGRWG